MHVQPINPTPAPPARTPGTPREDEPRELDTRPDPVDKTAPLASEPPAASAPAAGAPTAATGSRGSGDASTVLQDYAPLQRYVQDASFQEGFRRYMNWLSDLGTPDTVFLLPHVGPGENSIEFLSLVFHEQVELRGWMDQGHRLEDILNVPYYKGHYEQVYPLAHGQAMRAELALVREYAERRGLRVPSEKALVLMSPMAEQRHVPVSRLGRRLLHNPEYRDQKPTREDLEAAAAVYADGGYVYQDLEGLLAEALRPQP